jgi:Lar family restriction alleviation protein
MMTGPTLKPCPFCGCLGAMVRQGRFPFTLRSVWCPTCEASGPELTGNEAAIAAWNRRAGESDD